jgi:hypothetical protein
MAGDRDATWFGRMPELSVAALGYDQIPTIALDEFDDIADFHLLAPVAGLLQF